jgi:uncharacterized iron-regulated membrane protein
VASKRFRKVVLQVHLWIGIAAALFLLLAGASGALLVFETQIDQTLNYKLARVSPSESTLSLTELKTALERQYPGYRVLGFSIPEMPEHAGAAYLQPPVGEGIDVAVNPYTGKALGIWDNNRFTSKLHRFHTHLLAGKVGSAIVGWSSVILLFLSITGLILWWRSKIFRIDFQTSGPKFQYDLHSTIGVVSSVFLLAFAWTGVVVHWGDAARAWAGNVSGVVARPADPRPDSPPSGAVPVEPARLLALALAAVPGARATVVELSDDATRPVLVIMKFPEDHTPAGRTRVFLDAYSGKVLALNSSRAEPAAVAYVNRLNREIHTGDIGGWPARIIAAVFSLSLPVLALSGPLLWWQRRQRR